MQSVGFLNKTFFYWLYMNLTWNLMNWVRLYHNELDCNHLELDRRGAELNQPGLCYEAGVTAEGYGRR